MVWIVGAVRSNRIELWQRLTVAVLCLVAATWSSGAITYVNVQDYGAVGDGTTDDRVPIQLALSTGLPVFIPKTTSFYKVSSQLFYSGHRIASDGATLRATATGFQLLTVDDVDGLYIGDLRLEYPEEQELRSGRHPLRLFRCTDFLVERVIGVKGGSIYVYHSSNGIIRDCQMLNASYNAFSVRSSVGVEVENCFSENSVSAFTTEDSRHVRIRNNFGEDASLGLRIEDSDDVEAEGNLLRYCKAGGTAYGPGSASDIFTTDITFRGNTLYHCYKTIHVDKIDPYVNHVGEFGLVSKMHVGDVLYDNNIVMGRDDSTLLTDLSANVVFNPGSGASDARIATDTTGTSYYTMVPYVDYIYMGGFAGAMAFDWLFYINFPSGIDLSVEDVLTMDFYWGATFMDEDTMALNLYSGVDRTGFICQIPVYNPYEYIALPVLLYVRDGVDASSVKCIELERIGGSGGAGVVAVSEIRKGLQSKIGHLHSYYHSEPDDGTINAIVSDNVFVDVALPYVNRKRVPCYPPTITEGTGITGTTAQRPADPPLGRHYYDTDLASTVYWDGYQWIDIATYCQSGKVSSAVHLDGGNPVSLRSDDTVSMDHYTIEAWIKPTTSGVGDRHIIQKYGAGLTSGFLLQLWSSDGLVGYQTVGGDFYAVMVDAPFPHDDAFHHVAMTFAYDGGISTSKLYIDGGLVGTASASGAPDHPAETVELLSGNGFVGTIDGLNVYTRVMSVTEIERRYDWFMSRQYAWWRFNEGAGTEARDSSPYGSEGLTNHHVGVLTDMNPVTSWVHGKSGKALNFDRTGYVDFGNEAWMNNVTNFTLMAWIKPNIGNLGDRHIIQKCDFGAPNGYLMLLWWDDEIYAYQSVAGDFYAIIMHAPLPHDGWLHHVAMTFAYDGATSTGTLYVDGVQVRSRSAPGAPDPPTAATSLQCGRGLDGVIDEVRFYRRTLTAEGIAKEYAMGAFYDVTSSFRGPLPGMQIIVR